MNLRTTTYRPPLRPILHAGSAWDPEAFVLAIHGQLNPVVEFLRSSGSAAQFETVGWVLMELTANAILAPMGQALAVKSGLSREAILETLAVNPVWGPGRNPWPEYDPFDPGVRALEAAVGSSLSEFLRKPLLEKFRVLAAR